MGHPHLLSIISSHIKVSVGRKERRYFEFIQHIQMCITLKIKKNLGCLVLLYIPKASSAFLGCVLPACIGPCWIKTELNNFGMTIVCVGTVVQIAIVSPIALGLASCNIRGEDGDVATNITRYVVASSVTDSAAVPGIITGIGAALPGSDVVFRA